MNKPTQATRPASLTILHTADWHLGQSFFGFDREYEHSCFLNWLLGQIESEQPAALLVAGDVFDTVNPSAQSQRRYYDFLARAHAACPSLNIVVIAGNHDAGSRLEAPRDLLESMRINVIGIVHRNGLQAVDLDKFLVRICDGNGQVLAIVLAIPYLRPSDVPAVDGAADPYLEGIGELYRAVTERAIQFRDDHNLDVPLIAMGHCHLLGGNESRDSERRLVVGGSEAVSPETFSKELAYIALGHLHKAQAFREGTIRYSGSPLPLSFAEINYGHQVLKVTFERQQLSVLESVPVPCSTQLLCVPRTGFAPIESVLAQLAELSVDCDLGPDEYPYLEVRVLEDQPDPTRRQRIEQVIEGKRVRLASIKIENPGRRCQQQVVDGESISELRDFHPEDVFLNAYRERYGNASSDSVLAAFRQILQQESLTAVKRN